MSEEHDRELEDLRPALRRVLPPDWDRAIRTRDQAALDEEVRAAWQVVFRYVSARVGRGRAEEVTQEVFARVLARLGNWQTDESVRQAYLVQAAKNLLRDQWRAEGRRGPAAPTYPAEAADLRPGPEERLIRRSEEEALRDALRQLAPLQREVLRLRILEGHSAEEVGRRLERSAESVRQLQHRALQALRQLLADEGGGR